jgi:orotate phosphoribosyltransferase
MSVTKSNLLDCLVKGGFVKHAPPDKPFRLKSGKTSQIYVDLRPLGTNPQLKWDITKTLSALPYGKVDYVAGLPLGGIALARCSCFFFCKKTLTILIVMCLIIPEFLLC